MQRQGTHSPYDTATALRIVILTQGKKIVEQN